MLVKQLTIEFDRWKDLLDSTNTSNNPEFAKCSGNVKVPQLPEVQSRWRSRFLVQATLKKLKVDLNDLSQTIAIVEKNRSRFKDIDDQGLSDQCLFVVLNHSVSVRTCQEKGLRE